MIKLPNQVITRGSIKSFMDTVSNVGDDRPSLVLVNEMVYDLLEYNQSSFLEISKILSFIRKLRVVVGRYDVEIDIGDIKVITTFNIPTMILEASKHTLDIMLDESDTQHHISHIFYLLLHMLNILDMDVSKMYVLSKV